MQFISATDFLAQRQDRPDIQVLDVRTQQEVEALRLDGAMLFLPLDQVEAQRVRALMPRPDESLYLICRTANRSRMAAQLLETQGLRHLIVVEGGMEAFITLGAPMVQGD